jgi:membrane-associated phospholipid phosphatase
LACEDPTSDELCGVGTTASFWSGHTAQAFTAAGLSCAHHAYAKIYGSAMADVLGCAGAISLSAATGTFRVLGDRHYASDVLVGFGIGERAFQITDCSQDPYRLSPAISLQTSPDRCSSHALASRMRPAM